MHRLYGLVEDKISNKTSTFGADISVMSKAVRIVQSIRCKLRSFGVEMANQANVYCNNETVLKNISKPESVLMKKKHDVAYHFRYQAVAHGMIRVVKESSETNLADSFTTKMIHKKRDKMLDLFTY